MMAKALKKMRAVMETQATMYKAVVQIVLLYGSESWVVMDAMLKMLEGFHHRLARRIAGISDRKVE